MEADDKWFEQTEKWAREYVDQHGGLSCGMILGKRGDGGEILIPMTWTADSKSLYWGAVAHIFNVQKVTSYSTVTEVWLLQGKKGDEFENYTGSLEFVPGRIDGLMLMTVSRDKVLGKTFELKEDVNGKRYVAEAGAITIEWEAGNGEKRPGGPMMSLLDYGEKVHETA